MKNSDKAVAIAKAALIIAAGASPMADPDSSAAAIIAGGIMSGTAVYCAAKISQAKDPRS